uniref:Uncharacterized protein n=1 Tax=Arundo donax TaxID=35708 RepID=A0A0A9DDJ4_ARUDO
MPDPDIKTEPLVPVVEPTKPELKGVQRRGSTEKQQKVHKLLEFLPGRWFHHKTAEAQNYGGLQEVAPVPGEHAGVHGLLRQQEGEHVVQERVRQHVDAVAFNLRWRRSLVALRPFL